MSERSEEAIRDGCYYLHRIGFSQQQLSGVFGITVEKVSEYIRDYGEMIRSGEVDETPVDAKFWDDLVKESAGDTRVTLVDEKGHFYHGRRSDLEKMETTDLMALFDVNKDFLLKVPQIVLDGLEHHKVGYNPLIPLRHLQESVNIMKNILERRSKES